MSTAADHDLDPSSQRKNVPKRKHEEDEDHFTIRAFTKPRRSKAESHPLRTEPSNSPARYSQGSAKQFQTGPERTNLVYRASPSESSKKEGGSYSFLALPAEIRNIIYELVLCYPNCWQLYSGYYHHISSQIRHGNEEETQPQQPRAYPGHLNTPSILLLCRDITEECMPILRSQTFIIDRIPPFHVNRMKLMPLTNFVGRATLQNILHLDLRVGVCEGSLGSAWLWSELVDELYEILAKQNRLITLRLLFRVCDVRAYPLNVRAEDGFAQRIKAKIKDLVEVRYPDAPRPNRITIEIWKITNRRAVFQSGRIYEPGCPTQHMEGQEDRLCPDREMFPGSITEFLKPLPPPFSSNEIE